MTSVADASLAERRHMLRQQLLAQRQLIARQLEPVHGKLGGYPRSMTMRFLIQRPDLLAGLIPGFVKSGGAARSIKLIIIALALFSMIQATSPKPEIL